MLQLNSFLGKDNQLTASTCIAVKIHLQYGMWIRNLAEVCSSAHVPMSTSAGIRRGGGDGKKCDNLVSDLLPLTVMTPILTSALWPWNEAAHQIRGCGTPRGFLPRSFTPGRSIAWNFCAPCDYKKAKIFLDLLIGERDFMMNHSPRWFVFDCLL